MELYPIPQFNFSPSSIQASLHLGRFHITSEDEILSYCLCICMCMEVYACYLLQMCDLQITMHGNCLWDTVLEMMHSAGCTL